MTAFAYFLQMTFRCLPLTVVTVVLAVFVMPSALAALVYSALDQGKWAVHMQNTLSTAPRRVAVSVDGDASAPAFSPNGQRVAFEAQGIGIKVCPLDASKSCQDIRTDHASPARPAWNPKTNELVFARYLTDAKGEDADLFSTEGGLARSVPLVTQTGTQDYPDFSPDGRYLAYSSSQTISLRKSGVQVVQQLWIMNMIEGWARPLVPSEFQDIHPDWSPSGGEIAFASNRSEQFEIWVVDASGDRLRQVTSGAGSKTWPAWSPDGRSLMFTMVKDGRHSLWLINADGTGLRQFEAFGKGSTIEARDADWR